MLTRSVPAASVRPSLSPERVLDFASHLFAHQLHQKRVASLADATLGLLHGNSLAVHSIGQALASAKGLNSKHATKQVDRLLSNPGLDLDSLFASWIPFVLAERSHIVLAIDWTDFDADNHSTVVIHGITSHGRSTALLWKTVRKSTLASRRNAVEDSLLRRLRQIIPSSVRVTILADRGFADQKLYAYLRELDFDYVIRFRANILVTDANQQKRTAGQWVLPSHRALKLPAARVTKDEYPVAAVVCVRDRGMKDAWCLATSLGQRSAREIIDLYAKRFTIEESLRDSKDSHFGMGLSQTHISDPQRRDRLLLVCAVATALLTLLGAAGESVGEDRMLKVNTVKTRTHSLLRQGTYYFQALPQWKPERRLRLLLRFSELLYQHQLFHDLFGLL